MSHIVTVPGVKFTDLRAIEEACGRLGWAFKENQTAFRWYGAFVGDTEPMREMFAEGEYEQWLALSEAGRLAWLTEHFGKCDHAIEVPGCKYEIGVRKVPSAAGGEEYKLLWDGWYEGGLQRVLGSEDNPEIINPFPQAYAVEKLKLDAVAAGFGWAVSECPGGKVCVEVVKY